MSEQNKLEVEILTGPLDGHVLTLETETQWTRLLDNALSFPWDDELGEPQATFTPETDGWALTPHKSTHNTYRVNTEKKLTDKISLKAGDILKASRTWLLVKSLL
jgi:hypothetical protein